MTIVLGICTYRRPKELRKLLLALPSLEGIDDLQVVVADNDQGQEGIQVCRSLPEDYPFRVTAMSQTSEGISAVRNAVADKALSFKPDIVAFLDDDEWPEPQWLAELMRIQRKFNADVVGGPTRPEFPSQAPASLLDNPYYGADLGLPDGSDCQLQAGGNFLIKACVLRQYAPSFFHEAFTHSGSEDLAFFTQLAHDGHTMRWAANAIVHEPVPDARLAPNWLKQRVINIHNSRVRVMQQLEPGLLAGGVRLAKTAVLATMTALLSACSLALPAYRNEARLLRWKFIGKMTAHLGRATTRGETY